jgi:hypothetical protein
MQLLSVENDAKTSKGTDSGYLTGILYLAPATESGKLNVCLSATLECIKSCLYKSGRGAMPNVVAARIARTNWLADNRASFIDALRSDIRELCSKASKRGLIPAVRINGTSDLPGIARQLAREFPTVSFYDYTKHKSPWIRRESNYHITFSYSGHNWPECQEALAHDVNVAVVFHVAKGQPLPVSYQGYPVIDGDTDDLRFLDPKRVIVGLRAKGPAIKADSAFVVLP